mmetsp:Transcript_30756/g.63612  ORF Transcript_30756/g.63612 Transcript_30756/m.63612 type:complete len:374 (+) Transcript_30756:605-1726(+)
MLKNHHFCQRLSRDLHPFGCYVIGHLPQEHPQVRDTTHSDRGLEGAFLSWDLHTPTVWLWSFRKKRAVCMHDPVFYNTKFPFKNPGILQNRDLTMEEVQCMHADDLNVSDKGNVTGEDAMVTEDTPAFSTPPTQPMHPPAAPAILKPAAAAQPPTPAAAAPTPDPTPEPPRSPCTRSAMDSEPSLPLHKDVHTWTRGADVPLDATLGILSDQQLSRALAHHKMLLHLPADWWHNPVTCKPTACTVMVDRCVKIGERGFHLDCTILKPDLAHMQGQQLQFPVGNVKGKTPWNVRRLLDLCYNNPHTLSDLGLTSLPWDDGVSSLAAAWMMATAVHLSGWRPRAKRCRACGSAAVSRSTRSPTDAFALVPQSVVG